MAIKRIAFASKDFKTGQQVNFKIIDNNNLICFNDFGSEWLNAGVYWVEYNFSTTKNYLIIATEITGKWKSAYLVPKA